jgi:multidrug efflux pump subunit AcrA (membrane-fusion protein)
MSFSPFPFFSRTTDMQHGLSRSVPDHGLLGRRSGSAARVIVISLLVLALVGGVGWYSWSKFGGNLQEEAPLMETVRRDRFVHDITERGSVESGSNVDIRCEVESSGGTTIIWIIPEGTNVQKGDLLCELDSSNLEEKVTQQQIVCNTSKAQVTQAEVDLRTAELEYDEYVKGKFIQELRTIKNKIFDAEETKRREAENLRFTRDLQSRGYVTDMQVDAAEFAYEQALNALAAAQLEQEVLINYTKEKMVKQLNASIETAKANLASEEHSYELDQERLAHYQEQFENCKIFAPEAGQVVYANETNRWGRNETIIEEGTQVRERQIIIKLPDPSQMQVEATINEASISLVEVGMESSVRLEAFSDEVFQGVVKDVNEYPEPTGHFGSASKEYETTIAIVDPPKGIRPGLTAEVKIRVRELPDVLLLPVQCIFEHGGKTYCLTYRDGVWDKREVEVGPTNDKVVVIESGLEEGEAVVMGAWQYRGKVDLPELGKGQTSRPLVGSSKKKKNTSEKKDGEKQGASGSGSRFSQLDKNSDGSLTKEELPGPMQSRFEQIDADSDGKLSEKEISAAIQKMQAARPNSGGPPGEGGPSGGDDRKPGTGSGGGRPQGNPGGGREGGAR